jgi:hypothetical protein
VEDEQVVLVLCVAEETRVVSVLAFPVEADVWIEELDVIDEQVPKRGSHPVPQHSVELPQDYSKS